MRGVVVVVPAAAALAPAPAAVTRPAAHAVAFICLGPGPQAPPTDRARGALGGRRRSLQVGSCRPYLQEAGSKRRRFAPSPSPHKVRADTQRGCGAERRPEDRGRVAGHDTPGSFPARFPWLAQSYFTPFLEQHMWHRRSPSPSPFLPSGRASPSSRKALAAGPSTRGVVQ